MSLLPKSKYVGTFFTHSGAIKFKKYLQSNNIDCVTKPVPRSLSSSCGVCVEFEYEKENVLSIISTDLDCLYEMIDNEYKLVYENLE